MTHCLLKIKEPPDCIITIPEGKERRKCGEGKDGF